MKNACTIYINGAIERGFATVLLQHGVLSEHVESIAAAYRDRHLISYPVIKLMVNQP